MNFWKTPVSFALSSKKAHNHLVLAPLTNCQSDLDGCLSKEEIKWLESRAQAGFGTLLTAAAYVKENGRGWKGGFGACSLKHQKAIERLCHQIHKHHSLLLVQLFHAGMRANGEISEKPIVCPSFQSISTSTPYGAKELNEEEILEIEESFVSSALLCEQAGADGVEIHGAHGYLLSQFIDSYWNRRQDRWGGCIENRARLIFNIIEKIRKKTKKDFIIGLRLSVDNFGLLKGTTWQEAAWITNSLKNKIDYIHLSLWDIKKQEGNTSLLTRLKETIDQRIPLMVAGGIKNLEDLNFLKDRRVTFAAIGKAAIAVQDCPKLIFEKDFKPEKAPYSQEYLQTQGISLAFLNYLKTLPNFLKATDSSN